MTPRRNLGDLINLSELDEPADHTPGKLVPGDSIHFFSSTSLLVRDTPSGVGGGVLVERGQTITVTAELLRLNVDRDGWSFLSLVDDPEAQIKKWGKRLFARGTWPADMPVIEPGTPEAKWALQRAIEATKHLPSEQAREGRRQAYAKYGKPGGVTALGSFPGGA